MNLYRRCGSLGTDIFNSATKAIRFSAVHSRAALHTTPQKQPYPAALDTSRILDLSRPIPVRTLYHRWFTPDDYVDLSDARGVVVSPGNSQADPPLDGVAEADMPYITYWRKSELHEDPRRRQVTYFPFPVNARGFLYFWQHPIPLASGIRFRVAQQPDVDGYLQGRDLLTPYGTPWHIPLLAIASSERYAALKRVLQEDGYIPPQLLDHCAQLQRSKNIGPWSQLIFMKGQRFYLDLGNSRSKIFLVGRNGIHGIYTDDDLFSERPYPFKSGIVSCRLETRQNLVAMRVLRVIEPVQFIEQYEGNMDKPQPGQLVTLGGQPQLFLSKKDSKGVNTMKRWQRDTAKENPFAWSWRDLQHAAGEGWTFPWNVKA
ncbi:hypothetical protein LXA43DRAFT_985094 [Ganoderma leucocontextum]|nr:hypothetical protein LXA43DRAFT_985094 [Ganoderma leucocontextum]